MSRPGSARAENEAAHSGVSIGRIFTDPNMVQLVFVAARNGTETVPGCGEIGAPPAAPHAMTGPRGAARARPYVPYGHPSTPLSILDPDTISHTRRSAPRRGGHAMSSTLFLDLLSWNAHLI